MGINTKTASTDRPWNPWVGCCKVSPGCKHCYMFRMRTEWEHDATRVGHHTYSNLPS